MKTIIKKKYTCFLCGEERTGNVSPKAHITCWLCVQKLLNTPKGKIKTLYDKFIEKSWKEKAELIEIWIREPETEVTYEKFERALVGARSNRKVSFAKQKWEKSKSR